jgi:hypothetical protein
VWFSTVLLGGCFILKIKHLIIIFWKFGKSKNLHSKCFKKKKIGIKELFVSFF